MLCSRSASDQERFLAQARAKSSQRYLTGIRLLSASLYLQTIQIAEGFPSIPYSVNMLRCETLRGPGVVTSVILNSRTDESSVCRDRRRPGHTRDLPNLGVQCIGKRDRAEGVSIQDKKAERGFQRRPVFRGDGCSV
jgi:hypothetical protein